VKNISIFLTQSQRNIYGNSLKGWLGYVRDGPTCLRPGCVIILHYSAILCFIFFYFGHGFFFSFFYGQMNQQFLVNCSMKQKLKTIACNTKNTHGRSEFCKKKFILICNFPLITFLVALVFTKWTKRVKTKLVCLDFFIFIYI
jgi:hypothetical protein